MSSKVKSEKIIKLNNLRLLFLAKSSKLLGRGKYFRKKLFKPVRILELNYPPSTGFTFVQVGANDGISFDFLYRFVTNRDSVGIAIEPIEEYFVELKKNYNRFERIQVINKAVFETKDTHVIYKVKRASFSEYPDWVKGIASFNKSHITKFEFIREEDIIEEYVEGDRLDTIIEKAGLQAIDYLQIDTEGYDYKVLSMFDFQKFHPSMIKVEYVNLNHMEKQMTKDILKKHGYNVYRYGLDLIGIDINILKL